MNDRMIDMLKSVRHMARGERHFTDGEHNLAPSVAVMYLQFLKDSGLIRRDGSVYRITQSGIDLLDSRQSTSPRTITNYNSAGTYRTPDWNIRPGGQDHLKYKSRGV